VKSFINNKVGNSIKKDTNRRGNKKGSNQAKMVEKSKRKKVAKRKRSDQVISEILFVNKNSFIICKACGVFVEYP
jgi:hypothetical protein